MTMQREEHGTEHDTGAPADGALSDEALDSVSGGATDLLSIFQMISNLVKQQSDAQNEVIKNLRG